MSVSSYYSGIILLCKSAASKRQLEKFIKKDINPPLWIQNTSLQLFLAPCRVFMWAFLSRQNRAIYGYVLWRASLNLLYFSQPSLQSLPDSVSALARSGSRLSPSNIGYDLKAILAPSLAATCQQEERVAFHCQFDVLHWQFLTAGIAQSSIECIDMTWKLF